MKKITYLFTLIAFILFSCEKDEVKAVMKKDITPPSITSPSGGYNQEVNETDTLDQIIFSWSPADYGVDAVVTYVLQIDSADRQFSKAVTLGTLNNDSLTITLGELNKVLLNDLKLPANQSSAIEIKVSASLNSPDTLVDHQDAVASSVVQMTVTTWKKIKPPVEAPATLWVPGAYQGWSPDKAPVIYQSGEDTYEGYVYMNVGDYYKFTSAADWNHINYGSAGEGKLSTDGLAEGLKVASPGYYKFTVNTNELTYSATLINTWGMIGTATSGSWDSSTPMTFEESNGTWSATVDLVPGALKFRANDAWDINYGPADVNALSGVLINTNDAIDIKEAGNYTVTIDLSKSNASHDYTYMVTKNN